MSELKALRDVIAAQDALLVAYRLGSHSRADSALTRLEKARARLAAIESPAPSTVPVNEVTP